ncbi:unnamed protein product [Amoebophrya sp. A25]|nr:unnamed protein product [Amoebophrya sp. A25]|eukprot:GSA25T00018602001.1
MAVAVSCWQRLLLNIALVSGIFAFGVGKMGFVKVLKKRGFVSKEAVDEDLLGTAGFVSAACVLFAVLSKTIGSVETSDGASGGGSQGKGQATASSAAAPSPTVAGSGGPITTTSSGDEIDPATLKERVEACVRGTLFFEVVLKQDRSSTSATKPGGWGFEVERGDHMEWVITKVHPNTPAALQPSIACDAEGKKGSFRLESGDMILALDSFCAPADLAKVMSRKGAKTLKISIVRTIWDQQKAAELRKSVPRLSLVSRLPREKDQEINITVPPHQAAKRVPGKSNNWGLTVQKCVASEAGRPALYVRAIDQERCFLSRLLKVGDYIEAINFRGKMDSQDLSLRLNAALRAMDGGAVLTVRRVAPFDVIPTPGNDGTEVLNGNVCCDVGFPVAIDQNGVVQGGDERHSLSAGDIFLTASGMSGFLHMALEFAQASLRSQEEDQFVACSIQTGVSTQELSAELTRRGLPAEACLTSLINTSKEVKSQAQQQQQGPVVSQVDQRNSVDLQEQAGKTAGSVGGGKVEMDFPDVEPIASIVKRQSEHSKHVEKTLAEVDKGIHSLRRSVLSKEDEGVQRKQEMIQKLERVYANLEKLTSFYEENSSASESAVAA